jgi:hypothetical protein
MISDNDILSMLRSQPGLKGREIAQRLSADKSEVNSALWSAQTSRSASPS